MHSILPPAHDLVRYLRSTHQEMVEEFRRGFLRSPPPWTYGLVRKLAGIAFERKVPLSALTHTLTVRMAEDRGRGAAIEAIKEIYDNGKGPRVRSSSNVGGVAFAVRPDLSIRGVAHFYYVEDGVPKVVFVQARCGFNPTDQQLGLLRALMNETLLNVDFRAVGATCEILDLSVRNKRRQYRLLSVDDFPAISEVELRSTLARIVAAFDEAVATTDWAEIERRKLARDAEAARREADKRRRNRPDLFAD